MGVLQPRARNLLITSNPDMPGNPMSRMTRLQGSESTRNRAVSPSLAQSAACPAALRSAIIPRDRAGSSSTSRIRAINVPPYSFLQVTDLHVQPNRPPQAERVTVIETTYRQPAHARRLFRTIRS